MPHYKGSCHCGAISFDYDGEEITKGIRCNCSICSRKGAMMSSEVIAPERLHIEVKDDALGLYTFGDATAKHYFCKKCGIYPFHQTARMPDHYRVNLGCIEGVNYFDMEYDLFDGKNLL